MTAVVVPVLVVLLVLANLRDDEPDDPPVDVSGPSASARADLPVLEVPVPAPTPETDAACPRFMTDLPVELAGQRSRPVRSDTPYAYAWGEPAIVLRCGVERPAAFVLDSQVFDINGVTWFVDDSDPDHVLYTAVDRPVYVELSVPPTVNSGPVATLSPLISATMARQEPQPGDG
ncbi:DUF3515 domain-containing protein [Blastococcus sp. URHD0036]|uniref:DUF3515 domain-containing protein n=1 Tax=Blastococcus sp. URHD0036 TaxID=1380356 RepID=UPI000497128B|nr:DUF3515 domain-containing protein [Blastococcus sp. URHD0036]